jgi:uncharacterized protein YecE (DUF72 family)
VFPKRTPPRRQLEEYVKRFGAVEGNSFFYALPAPTTLERWRDTMPAGFQILPKLPRELTHEGLLMARPALRDHALSAFAILDEKCGPVFLQLPPSYGPLLFDDLLGFLDNWPDDAPPLLVELRHLDWFAPDMAPRLHAALAERDVGRVILDTRAVYHYGDDPQRHSQRKKPRLPVPIEPPGSRVMLRFISHPEHALNDRWLPRWAELIDGWLREGREVYAVCHCPIEDHSPFIARKLQALLEARDAPVPPLPWNQIDEPPKQERLF